MKQLVASLARWVLKKEPVVTAAAVTGVLVGCLVHFGVHPSSAQRDLIMSLVSAALPVVFGFVARAAVWSPASHGADVMAAKIQARTAATAAGPTGPPVVNIQIAGSVASADDLAETVRSALLKAGASAAR